MHHSTHISTRFPYTTLFRSNKSKDADRLLTHVVTKIVGNRRITHHNKNQLEYGRQGNETPGGVGQHVQNILLDRKSTRLNSSHVASSYAVSCSKQKAQHNIF